jgi:hypothetical protein
LGVADDDWSAGTLGVVEDVGSGLFMVEEGVGVDEVVGVIEDEGWSIIL